MKKLRTNPHDLAKDWDLFFKQHPKGGPWDFVGDVGTRKGADAHVVDFIKFHNFDLESLAHITQHIKVLDCGCADGRNSEYLMNQGFKVTGIDFSKTVIERTQKRLPKGKFLVGDVRKLDLFKDNSFDLIIDAGALHANYPEDTLSIIKEYYRVLRSLGKMFVRVFNKEDETSNPIFFVDKDNTMPVFGYSESEFSNHIKDYFNIKHKIYDSLYGVHGAGCNYFYLERKEGTSFEKTVSEESQDQLEPIKDFLEEAEKEKAELNESYKESVRQTKERKDFIARAIDGYGE